MNWEPVIGAALIAATSITAAVLTYRRSKKVDRAAERSGVASETREDLAQLIDALQADNASLREEAKYRDARIETQLAARDARIAACETTCEELRRELNRMHRRYGNGDTPAGGTPATS